MQNTKLSPHEKAVNAYDEAKVYLEQTEGFLQKNDPEKLEAKDDYRNPLSIEIRKEVTILLSWGWPSDGFKIWYDSTGDILYGYYFFADWFEYEEFKLTGKELDQVITIYGSFLELNQ
jgi:hypothetical protein